MKYFISLVVSLLWWDAEEEDVVDEKRLVRTISIFLYTCRIPFTTSMLAPYFHQQNHMVKRHSPHSKYVAGRKIILTPELRAQAPTGIINGA
jgi:hypothetical protein